ncbi:MAG: hemolysin family protein [Blautia sp.]
MDDGSGPLWGCVLFVLFIVLNGILYGFGAAIQHINQTDVEKEALAGSRKARRLWEIIRSPGKFTSPLLIATTLLGHCYGTFGVQSFVVALRPYIDLSVAYVVVVLVSVVLLASLGILSFKKVCTFYPRQVSNLFLGIVRLTMTVLSPLTVLTIGIANGMARFLGLEANKIQGDVTEEEIISMVDEAHEQGVIDESEAEMIQNLINFSEKEAKDIMTPRKNMTALEGEMPLKDAIEIMLEEGYSRYPVYMEDLDNILGLLHFKDVIRIISQDSQAGENPIREFPGLIRSAVFIPETRGISQIFQGMQAKKIHMVIVVDEYGQTEGLVAMEDILEEIVGQIHDEYDEEETNIQRQLDQSVIIDGFTRLEELKDELGMDFGEQDVETLNGYLTGILDHIPTVKDKEVVTDNYRFEILSVENNTIQKVKAKKLPSPTLEDGEEEK